MVNPMGIGQAILTTGRLDTQSQHKEWGEECAVGTETRPRVAWMAAPWPHIILDFLLKVAGRRLKREDLLGLRCCGGQP